MSTTALASAARISARSVAVRSSRRGGPLREPDSEEGKAEASDIGKHVSGVGEQGKTARPNAANDLSDEIDGRKREDEGKSSFIASRCGGTVCLCH